MSTAPFTTPDYCAPDGPRWIPGALVGDTQIDGRGVRWRVDRVEQGGRVLHWTAGGYMAPGRKATTAVTETHPAYPSDAAVAEWQRDQRRRAREAARSWYP
jgi:hypothetical protein